MIESLKRTAESLRQLAETNSVVANLKNELGGNVFNNFPDIFSITDFMTYVYHLRIESVKDVAVMKTKIAELTTELKGRQKVHSL